MWLQRLTDYILKNRIQAVLFTFVITFVPIIGIFGIITAAFVTLCVGISDGAILLVAATLPYLISFALTRGHPDESSLFIWAAFGVAVLSNLMTWVFAVMLRRQVGFSVILQLGALVGVFVISIVHLAYPSIADWWGTQLQSYYVQSEAMAATLLKSHASATNDLQMEAINLTKQYASGLMVAGVLFNAILQLIVARWWQCAVFFPGHLRQELHQIKLSPLAGALFFISLVLSYLGNSVVLDIMPILYLLFGSAGLSLIHYLFGLMNSTTKWFWLSIFYIALIFTLPTSVFLIAIFALVDVWLDLRKRFKKI